MQDRLKVSSAKLPKHLFQLGKGGDNRRLSLMLLIFISPLVIALQPLIGGISAQLIIGMRFLILPFIALVFFRKYLHWPSLSLLLLLLFFTGFSLLFKNSRNFIFIFLSLMEAIILYKVGIIARSSQKLTVFWEALIYGLSLLNIVTIMILYSAISGLIDANNLLDKLGKDVNYGLGRFSLGNPIELPFLVCSLLNAALKNTARKKTYVFLAFLNLILCAISESRLIVIIGALIFFREWRLSNLKFKIFTTVILGISIIYSYDVLSLLMESIWARFNGADYGSKDDRLNIFAIILQEMSFFTLLIGNGLTSSSEAMRLVSGTYRSVESSFLQLFFETGLVGIGLISAIIIFGKKPMIKIRYYSKSIDFVAILLWVELLFLLPITDQTPLVAFGLGASSIYVYKYRYK